MLPSTRRSQFAVVDASGKLLGMLDVTSLRGIIFDETVRRVTPVDTVMDSDVVHIPAAATLLEAMETFQQSGAWVLPVVDESDHFLGTLSKSTIFDRYRTELIVQTADHQE